VIIINKGSIVAEDSPRNLTKAHGKSSRTQIVVRAPEDEVRAFLSTLDGVRSVEPSGVVTNGESDVIVEAAPDADVRPELARAVLGKGWDLLELRPVHVSLEDVFIDLVTEETVEEIVAQPFGQKEEAS
jgi:ABC-2 type transport system ATP-binding protein